MDIPTDRDGALDRLYIAFTGQNFLGLLTQGLDLTLTQDLASAQLSYMLIETTYLWIKVHKDVDEIEARGLTDTDEAKATPDKERGRALEGLQDRE